MPSIWANLIEREQPLHPDWQYSGLLVGFRLKPGQLQRTDVCSARLFEVDQAPAEFLPEQPSACHQREPLQLPPQLRAGGA
jgi:hypothetical protein